MAVYPPDGMGTDCETDGPDDCGLPVDGPIEVRFDRYILPKTAVRQSILVYTGPQDTAALLEGSYDVVERVVTYRTAYGTHLEPGLVYHAKLTLPEDDDGLGFRAFDGAPLVEGGVPLEWTFRTSRAAPVPPAPAIGASCSDALGVFFDGACADCHATAPGAPMGLWLDSGPALEETAVSRVAHQADTGPVAGRTLVDPPRFGTGMPLIDPGSPATSYLLYKLIRNPENFAGDAGCETTHPVPLPKGSCLTPPDAELGRLQDWFVKLDPMPPAGAAVSGGVADLRVLQAFILGGASTRDCP